MLREIILKQRIYTDDEWVALMNSIKKHKEQHPDVNLLLHRPDYGKHLRPFVDVYNEVVKQQEKQEEQNRLSAMVMERRGGDSDGKAEDFGDDNV